MSGHVELTEAEREALDRAAEFASLPRALHAAVEAIIAARLESVEREWERWKGRCLDAQRERDRLRGDRAQQVWQKRSEKAEAALADLRAKCEALADAAHDDDWEHRLRALLDGV